MAVPSAGALRSSSNKEDGVIVGAVELAFGRVSTSTSCGRRGEGNRSRRSACGGSGEFIERNRMWPSRRARHAARVPSPCA